MGYIMDTLGQSGGESREGEMRCGGKHYFSDCPMDLSKGLGRHRPGEVNASDFGAEYRSKLFDLDIVVLSFRRRRHALYIFGQIWNIHFWDRLRRVSGVLI
jgi:hypothetical protein